MDYFRKIIYLSEYEHGMAGENIGFLKLSKKQTRLKIEIHLSEERFLRGEKIYLLDKDNNAVNKIFYGTITEDGKEIVMTKTTGEMGMMKGQLAGVLIGGEGYVNCAGIEGDAVSIMDYVRIESERETDRSRQIEAAEETETRSEEPPKAAEGLATQSEEPPEEEEIVRVELPEDEHDAACQIRKLFATRTSMYPFEDDEIDECVQISPSDFSDFPEEYWHMGSNTFLLQGYYNYRHLILARRGEEVYIGIPGQYHRRDKYMADMFGFSRFKGIQKRQERLGDFGYWMKLVEIPLSSDDMICVPEELRGISSK